MTLEDTWNYDYAIDTGYSAMCPQCQSADVDIESFPNGSTTYLCNNCDFTESE